MTLLNTLRRAQGERIPKSPLSSVSSGCRAQGPSRPPAVVSGYREIECAGRKSDYGPRTEQTEDLMCPSSDSRHVRIDVPCGVLENQMKREVFSRQNDKITIATIFVDIEVQRLKRCILFISTSYLFIFAFYRALIC